MRRILISFVATFAVALPVFVLAARDGSPPAASEASRRAAARGGARASTDQRIGDLQATVRAAPKRADGWTLLAGAYLQKVRETGDAGFYMRAQGAVDRALSLRPADAGALTERSALELSRHDFRAGLRDALRARAAGADGRTRRSAPSSTRSSSSGATRRPAGAAGDGRSQAEPRRLRARVLLPRAARRPRRRAGRHARGRVGRRRGARAGRLRALAARRPRAPARPHRRRACASTAAPWRRCPATRPPRPGWPRPTSRAAGWRRPSRACSASCERLPLPRATSSRSARRRRPPARTRRGGADVRARARGDDAPAARRRQRRRRAGALRGRPRQPAAGRGARPPSLGGGSERALGRRPWVGPAQRRAIARRARVGAARAGPRLARSGLPDPCRADRAQRGRARAWRPRWLARARDGPRGAGRRPAGGAAMRRPRCWPSRSWPCSRWPRPRARTRWATSRSTTSTVVRVSQRSRRRALRARPGGDPDLPGARAGAGAVLARKRADVRARRDPDGRRPARGADPAPGRAHQLPAGRRAGCTRRAWRCCCARGWRPGARSSCATPRSPGASAGAPSLAEPGRGTAVRSDVTSADPTRRLRVYPTALLASPADRTVAHLRVRAGSGHGDRAARRRRPGDDDRPRRGRRLRLGLRARGRGAGRLAAAPARRLRLGRGARALARARQGDGGRLSRRHARHRAPCGGARGDGDGHPHDRCVRARARWRSRSRPYVLPEQLYPWLNLVSGLLVLGVGASVVRCARAARAGAGA